MLQFKSDSGHILYVNHFISFIVTIGYSIWIMFKLCEKDKFLHTVISSVLTFIGLTILNFTDYSWWWAPTVVLSIGFIKELIDRINKKKQLFDWNDILADLIGVTSVTLVYIFSFLMYVEM